MTVDEEFLARVATETRPRILEHFSPDSCIATTRILIDILTYFGIPTQPLPVEVTIFNEQARTLLETHGLDAVAEAVYAREPGEPGGPWTLGLGITRTPTDVGHLVVALPHHGYLLDGSLDQASRPHKNITLPPLPIRILDPAFLTTPTAVLDYTYTPPASPGSGAPEEPVTLIYRNTPQNRRYRDSPNWKHTTHASTATPAGKEVFRQITADAIRAIRAHT